MGVRWKWLAGLFACFAVAAGWLAWQLVMPRPGLWLRDQGVWLGQMSPADGAVVQWRGRGEKLSISGRCGWLAGEISGKAVNLSRAAAPGDRPDTAAITRSSWGRFVLEIPVTPGWNRVLLQTRWRESVFSWSGRIALGEVFLVAGQSSAAGWSPEFVVSRSNDIRLGRLGAGGRLAWRHADDPQTDFSRGSPWPLVGEAVVALTGRPVGFLNVAEGGTSIKDWAKGGRLFRHLVATLQATGPQGVRAILWAQGESDAGMEGVEYSRRMEALIDDVKGALGQDSVWVVATSSYVGFSPHSGVREGQQKVIASGLAIAGPDTDSLGREFRESDGVHFNAEGNKALADLWIDALSGVVGQ
jgi:hypothetical protein